jgi:hypothetical protein
LDVKTTHMQQASTPLTESSSQSTAQSEDRFAVGWRKLTREEFLEAISAAVLDTVQKHESEQAAKSRDTRPDPAESPL